MEKSRSWPSAHDWKSCIPQKGIEGSNPSFSAIKESPHFRVGFLLWRNRDLKRAAERREVKKCPVDTFLARGKIHRLGDAPKGCRHKSISCLNAEFYILTI